MRRFSLILLFAALLFCETTATIFAQTEATAKPASASTMMADQQGSWYRAEFLKEMDNLEKKLVGLAEAMPEDKFTWRPMEGVRSVSEVYMHLAKSNLSFPQFLGIKTPPAEGDLEKVTQKAKVVEVLKQSLAHVRQAATNTPATDWDKTISYNGRSIVVREAFLRLAMGMREHLGQSVAYARMNRVVPPWTAEREAQQQKQRVTQ